MSTDWAKNWKKHQEWQKPAVRLVSDLFGSRGWSSVEKPLNEKLARKYFWNGPTLLEAGPSEIPVWVLREQAHSSPWTISEEWSSWAEPDEYCALYALVGWELTEDAVWFIDRESLWVDLRKEINDERENMYHQSGYVEPIFVSRGMDLSKYKENYAIAKKALHIR